MRDEEASGAGAAPRLAATVPPARPVGVARADADGPGGDPGGAPGARASGETDGGEVEAIRAQVMWNRPISVVEAQALIRAASSASVREAGGLSGGLPWVGIGHLHDHTVVTPALRGGRLDPAEAPDVRRGRAWVPGTARRARPGGDGAPGVGGARRDRRRHAAPSPPRRGAGVAGRGGRP